MSTAPNAFQLSKPQLCEHLLPIIVDEVNVMLVWEDDHTLLTGRAYPHLVPLLDGTRALGDLVGELMGTCSPPEIFFSLNLLNQAGHLIEADEGAKELSAFWHQQGVRSVDATARLQAKSVTLTSLSQAASTEFESTLAQAGIQTDPDGDFHIVLVDDYLQDELAVINQKMLESQKSWLLVKSNGLVPWIGPIFDPAESGCWDCLAQRLNANRQLESFIQRQLNQDEPLSTAMARFPATSRMLFELAAAEVIRYLGGGESQLVGQVVTFDSRELELQHHYLTKRPQCASCGDADLLQQPRPVELLSAITRFAADGGHRTTIPELTLEKYQHHISPITGVVTSVVKFEKQSSNGLTFSYSAGHNFAMVQDNLYFLMMNLRNRSGGKGTTDVQARASAVCEAIERYSGLWRGEEYAIKSSYNQLNSDDAIHPYELMGYSEYQYDNRIEWNDSHQSRLHRVPERFDPDMEIDWTPVWSFTEERYKYVPSAYCYFGHPDFTRALFCTSDSNGNAAGNTLEEAILQGYMELIERDAVAMWWYNRVQRPALDLESFSEPYIDSLASYYETIDREFWVLDITNDLGVPVFVAVSRREGCPTEDILIGFGAHFDPRIALLRALTEINQFLPCVSEVDDEGNTQYWFHDPDALTWWRTAIAAEETYLLPHPDLAASANEDFVRHDSGDLKTDVEKCIAITAEHGLETLILDQTQPDIGLPVVKVMVPGLRHFWKRFGPGRLYDGPVQLGWLDKPHDEQDLNPTGIFF